MSEEQSAPAVTIVPTHNGPYEVKGEVTLETPEGTVIRQVSKAYLCRCGHSKAKPFCDGSHRRLGWDETVVE
jgi:CDGSH-type Zn-finger protein